jgi:hypothetical protein
VVGIGTFRTHSLLFFYRGLELDDRAGLLEGSGKAMRFIRLRSLADARRPEILRIVRPGPRSYASAAITAFVLRSMAIWRGVYPRNPLMTIEGLAPPRIIRRTAMTNG